LENTSHDCGLFFVDSQGPADLVVVPVRNTAAHDKTAPRLLPSASQSALVDFFPLVIGKSLRHRLHYAGLDGIICLHQHEFNRDAMPRQFFSQGCELPHPPR
jgi:hypothetical protein